MKGSEFERAVRKLARKKGLPYTFDPGRGKGNHGTIYYGDRLCRVKGRNKEIGKGLFLAMCKQLDIAPDDLT